MYYITNIQSTVPTIYIIYPFFVLAADSVYEMGGEEDLGEDTCVYFINSTRRINRPDGNSSNTPSVNFRGLMDPVCTSILILACPPRLQGVDNGPCISTLPLSPPM